MFGCPDTFMSFELGRSVQLSGSAARAHSNLRDALRSTPLQWCSNNCLPYLLLATFKSTMAYSCKRWLSAKCASSTLRIIRHACFTSGIANEPWGCTRKWSSSTVATKTSQLGRAATYDARACNDTSSTSAPISRYINSAIPILCLCALYLILITSFEGLVRSFLCFFESSCRWPNLSSAPHLQDNFIQRSPRWAKHYIGHSCVKCSLMAASFETSTRGVEIHGTPHVIPAIVSPRRTSPTIGV